MHSTMQNIGLQIRRLLDHGATVHSTSQVITADPTPDQPHRAGFADIASNAARLAGALRALGVRYGDRIATFMWNNQQHVEAYFAVPAMGAILHPLNIRLTSDQISYIVDHAKDKVVIVDHTLIDAFSRILPQLTSVEHVIVNGTTDTTRLHIPGVLVHTYATLLESQPETIDWPDIDENSAAAMCYTSGTTGNPKGVVYSHRSIYLHALASSLPDAFDLSARDTVLAVVPQFHVLAWGLPYSAFLTGASLALPDRYLSPEPLTRFITAADTSKGAAVPTVWTGLLRHLDQRPSREPLPLLEAIVGGSAMPASLLEAFAQRHNITMVHAWGMTEMSPLGTVSRPPAHAAADQATRYQLTQGRLLGPVEAKLLDDSGRELPWDGTTVGELLVRGPWITASYYGDSEPDPDKFLDGWLRTGDVGRLSSNGYLTITDRTKDIIKSGGEWIYSVELEGLLIGHPAVAEAAVIGVPDDKWGERPLAAVVLADGHTATAAELRNYLSTHVARWQLPDKWSFIREVPKTSVGKFDKKALRSQHAAGRLSVEHLYSTHN
ncbi:long-chain fatty acid--CoA ligase [Nocardia arthritidis]|uniref:long-chain fatty acid--CoA ligase n=1 Tax=Nocardia arthritidis TaxID=228602 RepID=UPI0007A50151|nr:long-chain fatty acid--CoA ligase [Nocardia arthritidis]